MPELALPAGPIHARALVFDKDGVLVDFDSYWGAMTRARVAGLGDGLDLGDDAVAELLAVLGYPGRVDPDGPLSMATRVEAMAVATGFLYRRGLPWVQARERALRAFEEAESRLAAGTLAECAGARNALATLRVRGWAIGVATTDGVEHAWQTLQALGMAPFVDALAGGDEVEHGKPHREMLDLVCRRLGVGADEAIVVGDGINDLLMARQAGARAAIGVLSGVSTRAELEPAADAVLTGAADLLSLHSGNASLHGNMGL